MGFERFVKWLARILLTVLPLGQLAEGIPVRMNIIVIGVPPRKSTTPIGFP